MLHGVCPIPSAPGLHPSDATVASSHYKTKTAPTFPKAPARTPRPSAGSARAGKTVTLGHLPEAPRVVLEGADTPEGPQHPPHPRQARPSPLNSRQDQITGRVPAPSPGCVEMGRSSPTFCTRCPHPRPRPWGAGAGSSPGLGREWSRLWVPHLPHEGQVPGEGALVQGVVFREEDP